MAWIYRPRSKRRPRHTVNAEMHKRRRSVYNTQRWKRLRALKLKEQPLCEECLRAGRITPAEEVHHIVSFAEYVDADERTAMAYDYDNLESICKKCHGAEHARRETSSKGSVEQSDRGTFDHSRGTSIEERGTSAQERGTSEGRGVKK